MARAQLLIPWSVTQTGGSEGKAGGGGWGEGEGLCWEGREEATSVPVLNDSLGQPPLHMLLGEREAGMQTQTNRWRGRGGLREVKLIREG